MVMVSFFFCLYRSKFRQYLDSSIGVVRFIIHLCLSIYNRIILFVRVLTVCAIEINCKGYISRNIANMQTRVDSKYCRIKPRLTQPLIRLELCVDWPRRLLAHQRTRHQRLREHCFVHQIPKMKK